MKRSWKTGITAIALGTMLLQGALPALAADNTAVIVVPTTGYDLTSEIRTAVKSVSVESVEAGLQLSATVRLYNGGTAVTRVPEYDIQVRTTSGLVYTLKASTGNKAALQPNEIGEQVYKTVIDSKEQITLDQLSFVKVDLYTYPKTETTLLAIPLTESQVYYETGGTPGQQLTGVEWGQAFAIPGVNSGLVYSTTGISEQKSANGPVKVVTVLAENPGTGRETVPGFRIDALSDQKSYDGQRTELDSLTLEPGEKKYIHFTIPVENGVTISNLLVTTTDTFVSSSEKSVIGTGKLRVGLPSQQQIDGITPSVYFIGTPIPFDPLTKVIDNKTQVSLMELHLHENIDSGYKTAVAKFKLTNTSDVPTPFPSFQTELDSASGTSYSGTRQLSVVSTMNPGLSYVVSYSFNLPKTETGDNLTLKLMDTQSAAPFKTAIAAVKTAAQPEVTGDTLSLYPFNVTLKDVDLSYATLGTTPLTYTYNITVDLDIKQEENIVVDDNFSKLRFEMVDNLGRIIGSTDASFTGSNKLISGKQKLTANSKADELTKVTINLYEVIQTANGEAKRFIKSIEE
ncbi:hypothetical protein [Paenibacillus sp. y28]|uniref:hypothetical protein n=1 Tax=Paenibacillus sp. y28 TaxID=3129110 RepID=UPI003018DFA6